MGNIQYGESRCHKCGNGNLHAGKEHVGKKHDCNKGGKSVQMIIGFTEAVEEMMSV